MSLIWPLPVTAPVGYDLLDLSLLLCWSSCGVSIQNQGVFFSFISHYLRNLRFVPSSLRTKGNADGSFCSGRLESSKDAEERSGGLVNAWSHPEIQCISLPRSSSSAITCPHFLSCSMQCRVYLMVGTCRAQVISLLQTFFSRSISLLASDGPLVDDMTSTEWLMEASPKTRSEHSEPVEMAG